MPETDFSGDFLNAENTKDGDIFTIKDEGEFNEIQLQNGKKKKVINIPVEINGKELTWTPWDADGKEFCKVFGTDSKNWVGHKGQISHIRYKSYGQTKIGIEAKPIV